MCLKYTIIPCFKHIPHTDEFPLTRNPAIVHIKTFICGIGAEESLTDRVSLTSCGSYELGTIKGPQDYISIANSTDGLQCIEDCIQVWIKQIEQVRGQLLS